MIYSIKGMNYARRVDTALSMKSPSFVSNPRNGSNTSAKSGSSWKSIGSNGSSNPYTFKTTSMKKVKLRSKVAG